MILKVPRTLKVYPPAYGLRAVTWGGEAEALSGLGDSIDIAGSDIPLPPDVNVVPDMPPIVSVDSSGGGISINDILRVIGTAGQVAAPIIRSITQPSVVPGSQLVYNPRTGQLVPANTLGPGAYGFVGGTGAGVGISSGTLLAIAGVAVAGIVLAVSLGRRS